jgi:hypothetical protein
MPFNNRGQADRNQDQFLSSRPSCLDLVNTCALVLLKNEEADQKDKGHAQAGFRQQHTFKS